MKLFLDVDGVLLTKGGQLAPHAPDFLQFATSAFSCYWLTTHVREQDTAAVTQHLLQGTPAGLKAQLVDVISSIAPAPWPKWKTDALPGDGDFRWLDDSPTASEIEWLRERNWLNRWLHVDVDEQPDDLVRTQGLLRDRLK